MKTTLSIFCFSLLLCNQIALAEDTPAKEKNPTVAEKKHDAVEVDDAGNVSVTDEEGTDVITDDDLEGEDDEGSIIIEDDDGGIYLEDSEGNSAKVPNVDPHLH